MKIEELRKMEDVMIKQKLSGRFYVEWLKGGIRDVKMTFGREECKKILLDKLTQKNPDKSGEL